MLIKKIAVICLFVAVSAQYGYSQSLPVEKDFLLGKVDYTKDSSFVKASAVHSSKSVYLKKATYAAFVKMYDAALKDGIRLVIVSGTRSFNDQRSIWNRKWNAPELSKITNDKLKAKQLLRWSSMPGTSRHHWGTDIDLNNLQVAYYRTPEGIKLYNWLLLNASKYGFYQPFNRDRTTGYQEEMWHWSFVPLSGNYLKEYMRMISYSDISGFSGAEEAEELDIIRNWVLGVNPEVVLD